MLQDVWVESAEAFETLRDGAVVPLLSTTMGQRKGALARLLGIAGQVDSLELEVENGARQAERRGALGR
jgi:hypothetical protein